LRAGTISSQESTRITELLIENGAEAYLTEYRETTSQMFASANCYTGVIKIILNSGADISLKRKVVKQQLR
jgi:hypothetical protein